MAQALVARYLAHGYPAARVESRTMPDGRLGQVTAVFAVTPGPQVLIGRATVDGNAGGAELLQRLGAQPGRPLDREAFEARVRAAEDALRDDGYYEAVVSATVSEAVAGVVDVAVRGDRGDRVQVTFAGDPLPDDRRRALVPIERLQSVDEEVVEDGSRNIEQYLRLEGFRAASAPATRRRANGVLQIAFTIARGPLHVLGAVTLDGRGRHAPRRTRAAAEARGGRAVRGCPRRRGGGGHGRALPGARLLGGERHAAPRPSRRRAPMGACRSTCASRWSKAPAPP